MSNKFDEPRERSCSLAPWGHPAPLSRGELTKTLAQSVTRRAALKQFGVGLASLALACFGLAMPPGAFALTLGPLIELSRPNAVGACDDGFRLPGTITLDAGAATSLVVNPAHPHTL